MTVLGRRDGDVLMNLSQSSKIGLLAVSLLFAVAAVTLVEWNTDKFTELESRTVGFTMLEAAGMRQVDEARAQVKERQKIEERAALRVRQAQAEVNMADQEKDTVSSELDQLDDKMDKENGEISKDQANAETLGDSSAEVILKAREREHEAKSDRRHADTDSRREKREEDALKVIKAETESMSKKAASELKEAMARKDSADKLREIAQKHLDKVAQLKMLIHHTLKSKIAKLQRQIDANEHAALRNTEAAKSDDAKYEKLEKELSLHRKLENEAEKRGDRAALSAEGADKVAEKEADRISGDLAEAQKNRKELADRLRAAENPDQNVERDDSDNQVGPVTAAVKRLDSKTDKIHKEMADADRKIRELEAAKAASDKKAREERRAAEKLKKLLEESQQKKKVVAVAAPKAPQPEQEREQNADNFAASMNYLNNEHMDAATGADDQGRDAVGRFSEGRRAYVGVYGRSPKLDSIATANLRQYEQDESELAHANYDQEDSPLDRNIF